MAAKKKINESEEKLEKICKKLAAVPITDWKEAAYDASAGRRGFSTTIDKFIFELYGKVRISNGKVSTTELRIYSQDEKFSEQYGSSPRLGKIYQKLVNKECDEAEKEFNKFLDS